MQKTFLIALAALLLSACGQSKYAIGNSAEEKEFSSLLRKLDKSKDPEIKNQLQNLFHSLTTRHLDNIEMYETLTEPDKWNKILNEYSALDRLGKAIAKSSAARTFISVPDYAAAEQMMRQKAAADYYEIGMQYLEQQTKASARQAYNAFSEANNFYPGYKDVRKKMNEAWQLAVINVVINPVTDQSSYYSQMTPNRFGNSFNSDLLQRSLVRDLGGDYSNNSPAKFYTDHEAFLANIDVDWIVDISWTNLDVPYPQTQTFTRNVSRDIEISKDSTGKQLYETVTGTLYITKKYFTAFGELELRVTDASTRENIDLRRFNSRVDWEQQYATFRGDRRALSNLDIAILNNNTRLPTRQEILLELYNKIYPQLKNRIYDLVY